MTETPRARSSVPVSRPRRSLPSARSALRALSCRVSCPRRSSTSAPRPGPRQRRAAVLRAVQARPGLLGDPDRRRPHLRDQPSAGAIDAPGRSAPRRRAPGPALLPPGATRGASQRTGVAPPPGLTAVNSNRLLDLPVQSSSTAPGTAADRTATTGAETVTGEVTGRWAECSGPGRTVDPPLLSYTRAVHDRSLAAVSRSTEPS